MLKVWQGNATIFAECTKCGSYGTAGHIKRKTKMTAEIAAAVENNKNHMMALRDHCQGAMNEIARQIKDGSMPLAEGQKRVRDIYLNHVSQVQIAVRNLPDPTGKVTTIATSCPWCGVEEEVEIETLPDNQLEPDFSLARPAKVANKKGE